ncbi:helix-turn-helix domain-containing protein [Ancylobacter sp. MQZ15Z-1]|uniref:Helix-turn-helix domain-containing protein n=1 Tax=Ancylobacter mangrovi TaxID=2972472 RepID=A0A9X2T462_9HYPH|nr:helix-turn-helix domain-containing protein [Ancylobacter mangrovi]MCS0497887.1 helix-turn-helix domain-containing protein [Ancylobacter mangrovi]
MAGRLLPNLTNPLDRPAAVVPFPVARRGGRPAKLPEADLRAAVEEGLKDPEIAERFGCSRQYVYLQRKRHGLLRPKGPRRSKSRFAPKVATDRAVTMPPVDHPALAEDRTLYPATVTGVDGLLNVLVAGANHWKIGGEIRKGRWAGFPVYALTLEERATCPASCRHWRSCFGNHMHFAKRIRHGEALEDRLAHEVAILQSRHPRGFAVRLHVLGDFYSERYVALWASLIACFPALHVFGFTARIDGRRDPVARALVQLTLAHWDRFALRFSNAPVDECSTVTVEHPRQVPADAVLCPQQTGKTESCSTCALCWQSRRRIAFLQH